MVSVMLGYPGAPNGTPAGQAHTVALLVQGAGQLPLSGVKLPEGEFVRTCKRTCMHPMEMRHPSRVAQRERS